MRVAAIQTTAGADPAANRAAAGLLVGQAVAAGASLVVLPEYFAVAGGSAVLREKAEPPDGPTVAWARDLAGQHRIWLVAGTFPERPAGAGPDARPRNTCYVVDPGGSVAARYSKVHLFDVTLPSGAMRESDGIEPGSGTCVVDLEGSDIKTGTGTDGGPTGEPVRLGLSVCYDLRFPELYRVEALAGATLVVVPAAFTTVTGPGHWEPLLRARAIENQVFVIGAGQVGRLPPGMPDCHGDSMIVDPWGTILARRQEPTPGVVVADLDFDEQRRVRAEFPVLANRRPEAYR